MKEPATGRREKAASSAQRSTTKQMHEKLLRSLSDRRVKRAFGG